MEYWRTVISRQKTLGFGRQVSVLSTPLGSQQLLAPYKRLIRDL